MLDKLRAEALALIATTSHCTLDFDADAYNESRADDHSSS